MRHADKKMLAVAVTAYLTAKQDDEACAICFWGKSEEEVIRDWSTPLDIHLRDRLSELMLDGHLASEDFKTPPALFGLLSRANHRYDC